MKQILIFSILLISGMMMSQFLDLSRVSDWIAVATTICLSYIMIQVGLEFNIDKRNLKSYGVDYLVAATAAAFPWIFCTIYFIWVFDVNWKEALLVGRFAAPTSAGILFTMLLAAGLGTTWLFRKVQVLAIFDDLDTVLLMIPIKMILIGPKPELGLVVFIILGLIVLAYRYLHSLKLPVGQVWLLGYGVGVVAICKAIEKMSGIHIEVLLPAFALGCVLFFNHREEGAHSKAASRIDQAIKMLFMFLVGCSLPKISISDISLTTTILHVVILTVLANLGKCFPLFCYRSETTFKERLAVCIAMFPRGEVGAGVLLVALSYGVSGAHVTLSGLSLALNLLLTGLFISIVIKLIPKTKSVK